jgi:hypothetical protein
MVSKYIIKYLAILDSSCFLVERWLNCVYCKLKYTRVGMLVICCDGVNCMGFPHFISRFILILGRQVCMFVRV